MKNAVQDYWINYLNDLEDQFRLDCSDEDIRTNQDAKKCKEVIGSLKKSTKRYFDYLVKSEIICEKCTNKHTNELTICKCIVCLLFLITVITLIGFDFYSALHHNVFAMITISIITILFTCIGKELILDWIKKT